MVTVIDEYMEKILKKRNEMKLGTIVISYLACEINFLSMLPSIL